MEAAEPLPGLSWQEDDDIQEEAQKHSCFGKDH